MNKNLIISLCALMVACEVNPTDKTDKIISNKSHNIKSTVPDVSDKICKFLIKEIIREHNVWNSTPLKNTRPHKDGYVFFRFNKTYLNNRINLSTKPTYGEVLNGLHECKNKYNIYFEVDLEPNDFYYVKITYDKSFSFYEHLVNQIK